MKQGQATVAVSSVLLLLVSTCLAVNPGFRTSFTSKGLDYSKKLLNVTSFVLTVSHINTCATLYVCTRDILIMCVTLRVASLMQYQ